MGQAEPVATEAVAVGSEGEGTEAGIFNPATQVCLRREGGKSVFVHLHWWSISFHRTSC